MAASIALPIIMSRLEIRIQNHQTKQMNKLLKIKRKWRRNDGAKSKKAQTRVVLPRKSAKKKKPWMTDEILRMIEERKKFKDIDSDKYKQLNKETETLCRQAKEK